MSSTIQAAAAAAARAASGGTVLDAVATAATAAARAAGVAAPSRTKKALPKSPPEALIGELSKALGPALGRVLRDGLTAALRSRGAAAGYATRTSSSAKGPLAFLSDPKLSIEQKLMRFLAYQNDEWEKQMNDKMKKLEGAQGSSSSGGFLGGIAGAIGGALKLPGAGAVLEKVGGPVLGAAASALGFPAAAPILAKYGGKILGTAAGAASSLAGQAGASSPVKDSDKQLAMMEIQQLMQKQKEMFSLVSGVLRSIHDTRSAVIGNIR
jgi:hypothetical protein